MKKQKTGIRKLVTWCVYDPRDELVLGFYATKKAAKGDFMPGGVIVKLTGTYAVPRESTS